MDTKHFLNARYVSQLMDVSIAKAYKIIRQLNDELSACGYITVSGKISKAYFEKKVYCYEALVQNGGEYIA